MKKQETKENKQIKVLVHFIKYDNIGFFKLKRDPGFEDVENQGYLIPLL